MAAGSAAEVSGSLGQGSTIMEGFNVRLDTKFGSALSDLKKFNTEWERLGKQTKPAVDMWNKFNGVFQKVLGGFKMLIAPLAIAGGLLFAFILSGQAGRAVFGVFSDILGAFADVFTSSLMPAIAPIISALVQMLPTWQKIFGSEEWKDAMQRLGAALGKLVTAGMGVLLEAVDAFIKILPVLLDLLDVFIGFAADLLNYLKQHPEVMKAIVMGLTLFVGGLTLLMALPILAFIGAIVGIMIVLGKIVEAVTGAFKRFTSGLQQIGGGVMNFFGGIGGSLGNLLGGLPHFQYGGVVESTGIALVHRGESFSGVQGGGGSGGGGMVVQVMGPIYGTDQRSVEQFAMKVMEVLRRDLYGNVNTVR